MNSESRRSQCLELAKTTIQIEIEALRYGLDAIGDEFVSAVELVKSRVPPGRVVIMGIGKSGHVGRKIAATLASTGTPAFFVHSAEAGHGDLGMITQQDVIIAISQSGKNDELLRVMPYIKRRGVKIIAMTGAMDSPLAKYSDYIISTAILKEACLLGLAPTASTTLTLALGDAFAICLLKMRDFTKDNFAETHPHGALGKRLVVSVADVMSDLKTAPVVHRNVFVKEALLIISAAGLGFVIAVDANNYPLGVFTDGDLRRCLDKSIDIEKTTITHVMSKSFSVIKRTQLAIEAVDLMEKRKISSLPVVDENGRVVGALNMRQLLQAGVV